MNTSAKIWQAIRRRIWLVIITTVIISAVGSAYAYKTFKPNYVSHTSLLVQLHPEKPGSYSEQSLILASQQLVTTFVNILESDAVIEQAASMINLSGEKPPKASISVLNPANTSILNISVTSSDPSYAKTLANNLTTVFGQKTQSIIGVQSVEVIDPPTSMTIKSNRSLYIAVSFIVGILVGCIFAVILELTKRRLDDEDEIVRLADVRVLGFIYDN